MKKLLLGIVALSVALTFLLIGVTYFVYQGRQASLSQGKPLPLERFEALVAMRPTQGEKVPATTTPDGREYVSVPTGGLRGRPSLEALSNQFIVTDEKESRTLRHVANLSKVFESMARALGAETPANRAASVIGEAKAGTGEWTMARIYLEEVVRSPDNPADFRYACSLLAWLDEDPEQAVRLLELSCADDESVASIVAANRSQSENGVYDTMCALGSLVPGEWGRDDALAHQEARRNASYEAALRNAVELTRATGSDSLTDYYMGRLRLLAPDGAAEVVGDVDARDE